MSEILAETIADDISAAIETAQEEIEQAQETADQIAQAAMATELGRRINEIERRLEEWQSNQSDQSEATAALVMGLTQVQAQLELLIQQSSLTPNPQSVEDGPRESQEAAIVEVVEALAPEPEIPAPPAPRKKRHNWI